MAEPTTHVKVTKSTLEKLKERKSALGLPSMDAVILHLLGEALQREGDDEGRGARPKGRKAARVKPLAGQDAQLLSMDYFQGKEEDVMHLTGVSQDLVMWFLKLLQAQVRLPFFFLV